MQKKLHFPILLLIFPFIISAQSTAKDWYNKGIELKDKEDYENALNAFKMQLQKIHLIAKLIMKRAGVAMN